MSINEWIIVVIAVSDYITIGCVNCSQISLWVSSVEAYSSQWDSKDYSANEVIGDPDVYPNYGDLKGAWAQDTLTRDEYIQVKFEYELYIDKVNIYETYNCGGVRKVELLSGLGWVTIWEATQVQQITTSRIFSPDINHISFPSNILKLTVDCTFSNSWVEIDAIQITGRFNISVTTEGVTSTVTTQEFTSTITTKEDVTTANQDFPSATTEQSTKLTSLSSLRDSSQVFTSSTSTATSTGQDFNCCCTFSSNSTKQLLSERLQEIRRILFLPRNLTGKYNRSKLSAEDDRPSSIALGTSAGIVTLVLLASLIIACDVQFIYRRKNVFQYHYR